MARTPTRSAKLIDSTSPETNARVAAQANVDSLQSALGLDATKQAPDTFQAAVFAQNRSMSASPYTSAEMLQAYVSAGFSELVPKIVESIDRQAAHRQRLEETCTLRSERREDRAQTGALIVAIIGLLGSLVAAYMGRFRLGVRNWHHCIHRRT